MARKRTGLRNRFRSGAGPYSVRKKSRQSDMYGEYNNGKCTKPDIIAGHMLNAVGRQPREDHLVQTARLSIPGPPNLTGSGSKS